MAKAFIISRCWQERPMTADGYWWPLIRGLTTTERTAFQSPDVAVFVVRFCYGLILALTSRMFHTYRYMWEEDLDHLQGATDDESEYMEDMMSYWRTVLKKNLLRRRLWNWKTMHWLLADCLCDGFWWFLIVIGPLIIIIKIFFISGSVITNKVRWLSREVRNMRFRGAQKPKNFISATTESNCLAIFLLIYWTGGK